MSLCHFVPWQTVKNRMKILWKSFLPQKNATNFFAKIKNSQFQHINIERISLTRRKTFPSMTVPLRMCASYHSYTQSIDAKRQNKCFIEWEKIQCTLVEIELLFFFAFDFRRFDLVCHLESEHTTKMTFRLELFGRNWDKNSITRLLFLSIGPTKRRQSNLFVYHCWSLDSVNISIGLFSISQLIRFTVFISPSSWMIWRFCIVIHSIEP